MTRPVHSCSRDDSVKHLMSETTRKRIRHLPVIDDGVLCGHRQHRRRSQEPRRRSRDGSERAPRRLYAARGARLEVNRRRGRGDLFGV